MRNMAAVQRRISVYKHAAASWHATVMLGGKRLHRALHVGATPSDARRQESELTFTLLKLLLASSEPRLATQPSSRRPALCAEHATGRGYAHAYLRLPPMQSSINRAKQTTSLRTSSKTRSQETSTENSITQAPSSTDR